MILFIKFHYIQIISLFTIRNENLKMVSIYCSHCCIIRITTANWFQVIRKRVQITPFHLFISIVWGVSKSRWNDSSLFVEWSTLDMVCCWGTASTAWTTLTTRQQTIQRVPRVLEIIMWWEPHAMLVLLRSSSLCSTRSGLAPISQTCSPPTTLRATQNAITSMHWAPHAVSYSTKMWQNG